jgi:hypothetical protein
MDPRDSAAARPEPSPSGADLPERLTDPPPPKSKAVTQIPTTVLSEPVVVLDDPPAIFGGASHTW